MAYETLEVAGRAIYLRSWKTYLDEKGGGALGTTGFQGKHLLLCAG